MPTKLNRHTNLTSAVPRLQGKITLEEAIGATWWPAFLTTPPTNQIAGLEGLPFSAEFLKDVDDRLTDIPSRLASMDQSGIAYQIVSLTSPGIEGIFDAKTAVEYAVKINDMMVEQYVKPHPTRFGFFCSVPLQDPEAAAKELERAVGLGALGVLINGYSNLGSENNVQYVDEPQCEVFWQMVSKLDVPVYLHPRPAPPDQQRLYRGYPNLAQAGYGFGAETGGHALRIICSGLLDRYPNVRIVLGHCAEAIPFLIHRVQHRIAIGTPGCCGPFKKDIMFYFHKHFYATTAGVRRESTLRCTLEELGEDHVMFSVDYPYESNEDTADWYDALALNENTRTKLAYENAKRIFKITALD